MITLQNSFSFRNKLVMSTTSVWCTNTPNAASVRSPGCEPKVHRMFFSAEGTKSKNQKSKNQKSKLQNPNSKIQKSIAKIQNSKSEIRNPKSKMLILGFGTPGPGGFRTPKFGCFTVRSRILGFGHSILAHSA